MKILYMTREYPPHVYGGAGVHLGYLTREMQRSALVEVRYFGSEKKEAGNVTVEGYPFESGIFAENPIKAKTALMALQTCMHFVATPIDADVVHCHTWYAAWGGVLAKICYGKPLVVTVHSLEPLRPWKRDQLGRGYDLSLWVEKTSLEMADAVIAVSEAGVDDILHYFDVPKEKIHVVHNGIDVSEYRPVDSTDALERYRIPTDRPYVLFLGRITRQKGITHLLDAVPQIDSDVPVVFCAAAPDTPEIAREVEDAFNRLHETRGNVIQISETVTKQEAMELYSHAAVFCCPSIYEPFGLINLEAMACETPVVASAVGGIKEIVVPGETGELVPVTPVSDEDPEPKNPDQFAKDLAQAINKLLADDERRATMGKKGRRRVEDRFSWQQAALKTMEIYRAVCRGAGA